ncbi:MAG TPA: sigma 54-interacting transcriptional regulator [Candidatus Acidoferrales bacterium]|nr:sigma 54-interacting transcriptional regulator [Candidatus Acidoferrales bacterium]
MERGRDREAVEIPVPDLVGESPAWRELVAQLPAVAASGLPVLLLGETGSGKELIARALHALSPRRRHAFVAHNCGATPDSLIESELFGHARGAFTGAVSDRAGLFDAAERGTLFLDEIGDASPLLQTKLLRVLQEGEARRVGETRTRRVDVRVVSATHRPLEQAVGPSAFRVDLYFRLSAVRLRLPPLRERGRDVLLLARHFLAQAASRAGCEPPALDPALAERLLRHAWPGNARELSNACQFAVRVAGARGTVTAAHWPEVPFALAVAESAGLHAETRALEQRRLSEALRRTHGNKTQAARALGLSRQGLLKKLRRYGLGPAEAADVLDAGEGAD